jgi:hypothetical protein
MVEKLKKFNPNLSTPSTPSTPSTFNNIVIFNIFAILFYKFNTKQQ